MEFDNDLHISCFLFSWLVRLLNGCFNVTCNDISVTSIYVTARRCAGGPKKK